MAKIVGGMTTSHIPAIGNAITKGLQNEPYWKPFFEDKISEQVRVGPQRMGYVQPEIRVIKRRPMGYVSRNSLREIPVKSTDVL